MPRSFYSVDTLKAEDSVGYLIKRCGILMTQIAEGRFQSQPVSFTQWIILIQLTRHTHLSPTELSLHLGYDMGALTRIVDDLQAKRLVHRGRSEHDRRAVQIAVTPEGRRLAFSIKATVVDLINDLVEPFTKAETEMLISLLQRLLLHMEGAPGRYSSEASMAAEKSLSDRHAAAANVPATPSRKVQRIRRKSLP